MPDPIVKAFGRPPLIGDEKIEDYSAFFCLVAAERKPQDSISWFHLKDFVDQSWEIQREHRIKASAIQAKNLDLIKAPQSVGKQAIERRAEKKAGLPSPRETVLYVHLPQVYMDYRKSIDGFDRRIANNEPAAPQRCGSGSIGKRSGRHLPIRHLRRSRLSLWLSRANTGSGGLGAVASDLQVLANQRNAQKSNGPRSAAGRAQSSRNAVRHGLATNIASLSEYQDDIDQLAAFIEQESADNISKACAALPRKQSSTSCAFDR